MKTLQTERLLLRPFEWADFEEFHRLAYADPAVAPWWTGRTKTLDEVRGAFAAKVEQRAGQPGWLAIVLRDSGVLIGAIALQRWRADEDASWLVPADPADAPTRDPDVVEVELAYVLGRPYWGLGYATEAARAVLDYGFGELGVRRVISPIFGDNERSIALARRVGCRVVPNLHPRPSRFSDVPGVIAILDRSEHRLLPPSERVPG